MGIYSKLDGTVPISPPSSGVWKIQKKRRTDDRKSSEKKKGKKSMGDRDTRDNLTAEERDEMRDTESLETEIEIGYGSARKKSRAPQKIDLTI